MMSAALSMMPPTAPRMAQETRKALQWASDRVGPEDTLRVIWRLLEDAAITLSRLPDRERTWLQSGERSGWPEVVHTPQEQYEAELQRLTDLKMSKEEAPLPRGTITDPSAIPRMLTVLEWLRYVRARTAERQKRDVFVVLALAIGMPPRIVRAKYFRRENGDSAVLAVKNKALRQIEAALASQGLVVIRRNEITSCNFGRTSAKCGNSKS